MRSDEKAVEAYIETLTPERREILRAVRAVILENLPDGYEEAMRSGRISYEIPLARYPQTYNRQPLVMAALASQKNFMTLYLMNVYGDKETEAWFRERYAASGKKLDMGKSCVHFKQLDNLPLELIGEVMRRASVEEFIQRYERARSPR